MNQFDTSITSHNEIYNLINKYKKQFGNSSNKDELIKMIDEFKTCLIPILDYSFAIDEKNLLPIFQTKEEGVSIKCILDLHIYIFTNIEELKILLENYYETQNGKTADRIIDLANDIIDDIYNYAYSEDCLFSSFLGVELTDKEKLMIARDLARLSCNIKIEE